MSLTPLLIALVCVALLYLLFIGALLLAGRDAQAAAWARLVPDAVGLFSRLVRDPRVPLSAKLLLGFGLVYLVSPIDLVPDFIPVVGVLDDTVVVALVLRYVLRAAGPELVATHWRGPRQTLRLVLRLAG
jgi:uncharacterized membrane protein YkvA (DUF1232 family)